MWILKHNSWMKSVLSPVHTCTSRVKMKQWDISSMEIESKSLLQSHTDKRSFIVYLWTFCTFIISNKDDSSTVIKPLGVELFGKELWINNEMWRNLVLSFVLPSCDWASCIHYKSIYLAKTYPNFIKDGFQFKSSVFKSILKGEKKKKKKSFETNCEMPQ